MTAARERLPRLLSTGLALVGVATVVVAALIWGARGFPPLPTSMARGFTGVSMSMVSALCYIGAGWLLASRMPRNPIGWLLLTIGLGFATMTPTALLVHAAEGAFRPAPATTVTIAWLLSSFSAPVLVGLSITVGLLFPDGRLAGPGWRWAVVLTAIGAALIAIATAVNPSGLVWYPTLPNPYAAPSSFRPTVVAALAAGALLMIAALVAMVMSTIGRYRRGDATVRAQLRWIMYAAAVLATVVVPFMVIRFVVPVGDALGEVMVASANAASDLVPIAAAVAIMRYGLFGIDFVISRTFVYVPLMAILGGLYTVSIALFQRIFVAVTGETSDAPLLITIFLVAAAFTPVRKGLEGTVDRWIRAGGATVSRNEVTGPASENPRGVAPEIVRVAAEIIALRGLEERIASGSRVRAAATERRLSIDTEGWVACPADQRHHFVGCLGCRYLEALSTSPPTIICTFTGAQAPVDHAAVN